MKGPHLRLKFDFHRRWECPVCHAKARSGGQVTSMSCACGKQTGEIVPMRMTYDGEPMLPWRDQVPVASTATPAGDIDEAEE